MTAVERLSRENYCEGIENLFELTFNIFNFLPSFTADLHRLPEVYTECKYGGSLGRRPGRVS